MGVENKLHCVVDHITYRNPENGWSVMRVKADGYSDAIVMTGMMPDVAVGKMLDVEGEWKVDAKYGRQFVAQTWREVLPTTITGLERYLGSGLIRGVGPAFASAIVKRFGMKTLDVLENDIDRLLEIPGLGKRKLAQIKESWTRQKDINEVMVFLSGLGVSSTYAAKIYKQYGKESISILEANPYQLADDIWGIGFKTADEIAKSMGYSRDDNRRCRSGILYVMNEMTNEGDVYATQEDVIRLSLSSLGVDEGHILEGIRTLIEEGSVILDMGMLYLPSLYHSERGIARRLKKLLVSRASKEAGNEAELQAKLTYDGIEYDSGQLAAIKMSIREKVMVLTGGPGTGKTTTIQGIISACKNLGMEIVLAAPTGRAAKRMTEATGIEAKTIHRLLEYNMTSGYKRGTDNPIDGDVLIVDECSMIDVKLFYNLLKGIPNGMRLILVGDVNQLPSVGAGNVLRDIIESGKIPVVRLNKIFRQALSSRIVMNAHAINNGQFPNISNGKDADFFFINSDNPNEMVAQIIELMRVRLPRRYGLDPRAIQVLTPMQKGDLGVLNLNTRIQSALNATGESLTRGGTVFRRGDKVMQIRNNYDKNVFNGDIGYVSEIDISSRILKVNFDNGEVEYEASELDEIVLAYAVTIHKSQGSEFPIVIIPMSMKHYIMLQRNLIYTAVTRAKRICVIIGSVKALAYAIKNETVKMRNSKLKERLNLQ